MPNSLTGPQCITFFKWLILISRGLRVKLLGRKQILTVRCETLDGCSIMLDTVGLKVLKVGRAA